MVSRMHKRVLLKLSGEALMGDDAFGINRATIMRMTEEVAEVVSMGVQLAIVIGGGNIFRGVAPGAQGMDRNSRLHGNDGDGHELPGPARCAQAPGR